MMYSNTSQQQLAYQQAQMAPQMPILLITELPIECGEMDLMQITQPYGKIKNIEIKHLLRNTGKTMYGLVEYHAAESAENARNSLNGARYGNKILRAELTTKAALHPAPAKAAPHNYYQPNFGAKGMRSAQVHISYLSKQMNFIITAEFLKTVFNHFGAVLEISLKKTCVDPEMSVQNGYGFVHYPLTPEGINAALNAVQSLHQVTINQITYDCSISNQLNQILANMEKQRIRRGGSFGSDDLAIAMFPEVANQNLPSSQGRTTPVADSLAALINPGVPQPAPRQHKMNTSAAEYYPGSAPLANLPTTNATAYAVHSNAPTNGNRAPKYFQTFGTSGSGQNSASTSASTTPNSKYNEVPLAPSLPTALPYGIPAYAHDTLTTDVDEYNYNRANFRNQFSPGNMTSPGHAATNHFFGQSNSAKLRSGSSDSISYGNQGMTSYGYGNHIPLNSSSSDSFTSTGDREYGLGASNSNGGLSIATNGLPAPAATPPMSANSIGDSPSYAHKSNFNFSLAKSNSSTAINELLSTGNTPNTTYSTNTSIDTTEGMNMTENGMATLPNYLAGLHLHSSSTMNHQLRNEDRDRWAQSSGGSGKYHPNPAQLPSSSLLHIWNQPTTNSMVSSTNGIAMPPEPPVLTLPHMSTHQQPAMTSSSTTVDHNNNNNGNVYNSVLYKPATTQGSATIDDLIGTSASKKENTQQTSASPSTMISAE